MPPALLLLAQTQRLPLPGSAAGQPDTLDLPGIGRAAQRILADSLRSVPEQLERWAVVGYVEFREMLPRLVVALVVVGLILAATIWLHAHTRRRTGDDETATRGVGMAGALLAAIAGAAILGAESVAAALVSFFVFYAIAAGVHLVGDRMAERTASPEAVHLVVSVARYALITLGAVEALDTLGLELGGVLAGIGILGLAIGFAAQDSLANVIAGFLILWDRSIRVGDWVRIGTSEGRVRRVTLRSTRIETRDEGILVIPNKEITGSRFHNFSIRHLTRVRVPVDVHYETDIARARQVLLGLAPTDEVVSRHPEPFVAVTALGESAVRMELVFFITDPREELPLQWRLNEQLLLAFREAGLEISYPHLNLHLRTPLPVPVGRGGIEGPPAR